MDWAAIMEEQCDKYSDQVQRLRRERPEAPETVLLEAAKAHPPEEPLGARQLDDVDLARTQGRVAYSGAGGGQQLDMAIEPGASQD